MNRKLIALASALALASTLGGCGVFGGGGGKKPKTPVLGQRIAVLTAETGAEIDPALEGVPIVVPEAQANA